MSVVISSNHWTMEIKGGGNSEYVLATCVQMKRFVCVSSFFGPSFKNRV